MAYIVMAYIVMTYIVMAKVCGDSTDNGRCAGGLHGDQTRSGTPRCKKLYVRPISAIADSMSISRV